MLDKYDVVIGLEIHAQLNTDSKCFSSAPTEFTQGHNNHTTEVCAALPGTLPSLNQKAVDMAIRTGIIFQCDLNSPSIFARKQYFYPDMPKGYHGQNFQKHRQDLLVDQLHWFRL